MKFCIYEENGDSRMNNKCKANTKFCWVSK